MPSHPDLLFWDVDTQRDFMLEDGKLHVPGAERLIPNLERLTDAARRHEIPVIASADEHEMTDAEISEEPDFSDTYPPHCLAGTPGQAKIPQTRLSDTVTIGHQPLSDREIDRLATRYHRFLILKKRFDVFTNPNTERLLRRIDPGKIVLYGVALDVCNFHAIEGLWRRGYRNLALVTDAVQPIDPKRGEELLATWRRRGIEMITTREALEQVQPVPVAAAMAGL